jgi:hypothetical protein
MAEGVVGTVGLAEVLLIASTCAAICSLLPGLISIRL